MAAKIAIIYKSSTGFTRRYAEMIVGETGAELMSIGEASAEKLRGFDTIVFGGRLHAGSVDGLKKARALFAKSGAKRFVVFATGATPNAAAEIIEATWKKNLSADELESVPHFYMQGGLCYEKMGGIDRTMMKLLARMLRAQKNKSSEDAAFEQAIASSYDISDQKYILPLVECLRQEG